MISISIPRTERRGKANVMFTRPKFKRSFFSRTIFISTFRMFTCETGIFTMDAMVSVSILTLASCTLVSAFHAALLFSTQAIHREVAIQLAWQFTEESKQSHRRTGLAAVQTLNGITYDIHISIDPPLTSNSSNVAQLYTKVMWSERNGSPRSVEVDALDALPVQSG